MTPPPGALPGVDRAAFGAAFVARLRHAGIGVGLPAAQSFSAALDLCHPRTRTDLYWVARVTLVRRPSDIPRFDAVFDQAFSGTGAGLDPPSRRRPRAPDPARERQGPPGVSPPGAVEEAAGLPWTARAAVSGRGQADEGAERTLPELLPSALAHRTDEAFSALEPSELAALDVWLARAMAAWPTRRSRRMSRHPRGGAVALRPTLAAARRHGFEPLRLVTVRRVPRRRPVVMLCDVSQSMQPFVAAYLHLLRAAAVGVAAEVFVFATSLTRLTPVLSRAPVDQAVARATTAVVDRFGGTRIASSIATLLASRHGNALRGAIVVVASDGWDSDPPEALARQMARVARRAHRVIWLNPRLSAPGYAPLAGGMAAALPFCDRVLAADSIAAMADVVAAMTGTDAWVPPVSGGGRPPGARGRGG